MVAVWSYGSCLKSWWSKTHRVPKSSHRWLHMLPILGSRKPDQISHYFGPTSTTLDVNNLTHIQNSYSNQIGIFSWKHYLHSDVWIVNINSIAFQQKLHVGPYVNAAAFTFSNTRVRERTCRLSQRSRPNDDVTIGDLWPFTFHVHVYV